MIRVLGQEAYCQRSPFLALKCESISWEQAHMLGPQVMRWADDIWLMNLSDSINYWQKQAAKTSYPLGLLWQKLFQEELGENFFAAQAQNPWQALSMLAYMEERNLFGYLNIASKLGRNLYENMSWDAWLHPIEQLQKHWEALGQKKLASSPIKSQKQHMQRSIEKLGLACPYELAHVQATAIKRRFGLVISVLWEWSFLTEPRPTPLFFPPREDDRFPWIPAQAPKKAQVTRHLDEPLPLWEHIEPFLQLDLDRLCKHPDLRPHDRVTGLCWEITFAYLEKQSLPITFKNPHHMHKEYGQHQTVLYQAQYQFERAMEAVRKRDYALDFPPEAPIISWDLIVTSWMPWTLKWPALLSSGTHDTTADKLLEMENKLSIGWEHFRITPNFDLQASYEPTRTSQASVVPCCQWDFAASHRPFFIKKKPGPIRISQRDSLRFVEKNHCNWWHADSTPKPQENPINHYERDYFIMLDGKKRALWVYRNASGQWLCHGFFD